MKEVSAKQFKQAVRNAKISATFEGTFPDKVKDVKEVRRLLEEIHDEIEDVFAHEGPNGPQVKAENLKLANARVFMSEISGYKLFTVWYQKSGTVKIYAVK